jgi:hypothetical protein
MPRKPQPLAVYANPWHAPLTQLHRADCAVPWDPDEHNSDRGFVGAIRRLDEKDVGYFEFTQYEGTHALVTAERAARKASLDATFSAAAKDADAALDTAKAGVAALPADQRQVRLGSAQATRDAAIAAAAAAHRDAHAVIAAEPEPVDSLVLRPDHAPILLPPSNYYMEAIRNYSLWAADEATHIAACGNAVHFVPVEKRAAAAPAESATRHRLTYQEDPDPEPRPAIGAGRIGAPKLARPLTLVNPIAAANFKDRAKNAEAIRAAAPLALKQKLEESRQKASDLDTEPSPDGAL